MSDASKIPEVVGACQDLDAATVDRVTAFMARVVRAFAAADAASLDALSHPGGDPRGRQNSRAFDQALMAGGARVRGWVARPYTEPKWGIMRTLQHHPPPTVWVDVTLNDGERDRPYSLALAPDADGGLRSCYYIDRVRPRKSKRE